MKLTRPFTELTLVVLGAAALETTSRAQIFTDPEPSGWFVRLGGAAHYNLKTSITGLTPATGTGVYNDGFVQPDKGGSASGKTWNWGYNSGSQIVEDQLVLNRLEGVPVFGRQNLNTSDPILGGEILGGVQLYEFQLLKKNARAGFEIGYGYSSTSATMSFGGLGIATHTTDAFGLGGIVPPLAPYAGTVIGPGTLIDLNPGSHAVATSPVTSAFQGRLQSAFHELRFGPSLELDFTKRLGVGVSAGYSSLYTDARLNYTDSLTFDSPTIAPLAPAQANIRRAQWHSGGYVEMRVNYQFTSLIGAFVGGDLQHHGNATFGDAEHQVKLDLGLNYGAKAGLIFRF